MKARIFKLNFIVVAIALLGNFSAEAQSNDNALVKNYSKTYPVDANDKLQISNSYGKVTVITWDKNEIKVDVQIKISGGNAQKQLDNISIVDSKEGSVVSFKTNFGKQKSSWSWWWGGGDSYHDMKINYTVYMPAKTNTDINDPYGAIVLPELDGKVNINSAYGSLTAKSLNNTENNINVSYGPANIENLRSGDLNVKYGSLSIGTVDKLNANVSYSNTNIKKLTTAGNINTRYGNGLHIDEVGHDIKNLTVNSTYSNVKLGLASDMNAEFNVTVKYGDFNYGSHPVNGVTQTSGNTRHGWSPTQNYIGHLGKGNADKQISVSATYGSVKFD